MKKLIGLTFTMAILLIAGCASATETPAQQPGQNPVINQTVVTDTTPGDTTVTETRTDLSTQTDNPDVVFEISGDNFSFSETELTVEKDQTVKIIFTSEEGFHDWVLDEFDATTAQVQAGGKTEVTFVADKVGEFEYYCSVGQHRQMGMVGKLIVK